MHDLAASRRGLLSFVASVPFDLICFTTEVSTTIDVGTKLAVANRGRTMCWWIGYTQYSVHGREIRTYALRAYMHKADVHHHNSTFKFG